MLKGMIEENIGGKVDKIFWVVLCVVVFWEEGVFCFKFFFFC